MKASPNSTARFSAVVQQVGAPQPVTLWQAPAEDPDFRKAVRENRVMTIKQETVGTKRDFGIVGFDEGKNSSFLIFPRSLQRFSGKRIVGVRYNLLAPARPRGKPIKPAAATRSKKQHPSADAQRRFAVTVTCAATLEVTESVTAPSIQKARKAALARIPEKKLDFSQAKTSYRVAKVQEV